MNLREDKHWSYGAGSVLQGARAQRLFLAYSSVQGDKTADTVAEILSGDQRHARREARALPKSSKKSSSSRFSSFPARMKR